MPNIRYVCLSDLHLGEEDSLLTDADDVSRSSPALRSLAECLAAIVCRNGAGPSKPTLVLAGDVLDLALCPTEQTLAVFERFLGETMPANGELFGEIVYLPGNHDHHVWVTARESQYLNYLSRLRPGAAVQSPWDTTKVVMDLAGEDRLASGFATAIARRLPHLRDRGFEVLAAYPNFGVRDGNRAVVFHHGHFIEPAYRFFSTLASLIFPDQQPPRDVYTLERENSAWLDFFWSTLGSCGRIGPDVESIYEASGSEEKLRQMTDTLAASVARAYPEPKWAPKFLREWVLKSVLWEAAGRLTTGLERRAGEKPLSEEAAKGLGAYIDEHLRRQFERETGSAPGELAFVFGHTHKPFVDRQGGTRLLNTGGWVVDTPKPEPLHGAAAVLVADDLSTVSLRFYNEGAYEATVEEPLAPGAGHSPLYQQVRDAVAAQPALWTSFGKTVRAEVELRADRLGKRIKPAAKAAQAGR